MTEKFAGYGRLLDNDDMMLDFFEVPWQVFATLLKIIVKSLTLHFSDVLQKLAELQQIQTMYWFYEASCHS